MNALFDTSVLVAAFYEDHEHHRESFAIVAKHKAKDACCAAHTLAEVYATLTAMPGAKRVSPAEAVLNLTSLKERLTLISLNGQDYLDAAELAAASGAVSGGVYDALIGQAFVKSKAKWLYTWNLKHFTRLIGGVGERARQP